MYLNFNPPVGRKYFSLDKESLATPMWAVCRSTTDVVQKHNRCCVTTLCVLHDVIKVVSVNHGETEG